jgi:hypothetical protein
LTNPRCTCGTKNTLKGKLTPLEAMYFTSCACILLRSFLIVLSSKNTLLLELKFTRGGLVTVAERFRASS